MLSAPVAQFGGVSPPGATSSKPGFFSRFCSAAASELVESKPANKIATAAHAGNLSSRRAQSLFSVCIMRAFLKHPFCNSWLKQGESAAAVAAGRIRTLGPDREPRSEEHTSELQSLRH